MKKSILVVEDAFENINILEAFLSEEYRIHAAKSGIVALKIAEKIHPDLIILDIMMPEMDGYEVCEKLKGNPLTRDIPVIFITSLDDTSDRQKGLDLGAVDYFTKPINPEVVKAKLEVHLSYSNAKKE